MYTLEDSFIEQGIIAEAKALQAEFEQTGKWPASNQANMQLAFSKQDFPNEIRQLALDEPRRKEFYGGQGRHYHVHIFEDYPNVYLVAEVSEVLLVRPIRDNVIQFLIIYTIILTSIACLIAWWLGKQTANPLQTLADLVDGVAPDELSKKVPEHFADTFPNNEVGILAKALENSLQRIAQTLTREKNFTRDVSHELRTPLAIIKNTIELQRSQAELNPTDIERLDRVYEAAEQMEKTVQTLLVLAREEHTCAQTERVELMPIVEQSVLSHSHLLNNKNVEVKISDSCQNKVTAQSGMLKVLLDNLVSNAFQYTHEGEVSIYYKDGELTVADTGPGIESEIADRATEPSVKGNQSTGFGFGLSIVSRLCEHQGWNMHVESQQGTKVSVYLSK
jgi:signal transduction histidine kinase